MLGLNIKQILKRRVYINISGQGVNFTRFIVRVINHQRRVTQRFVLNTSGFAKHVLFAQIVAMISTENKNRIIPEVLRIHRIKDLTKPVIYHAEF